MVNEKSQQSNQDHFGRGLCYCLALFLSHEANFKYMLAETEIMVAEGAIQFQAKESSEEGVSRSTIDRLAAIRWFSRAANPIRNLAIPDSLPQALRTRLETLKQKSHEWSLPTSSSGQPSRKDVRWAVEEAKELLRMLDEHHGIRTVKEKPQRHDPTKPFLDYRDA